MFYLYLRKKRNNNRSYFKTGSLKKLILSASHSDVTNERGFKACQTKVFKDQNKRVFGGKIIGFFLRKQNFCTTEIATKDIFYD